MRQYSRIVVTGPQRSGTTIAAKMIASDTGYRYIDEDMIGITDTRRFDRAVQGHNIVIQAPHMLRRVVDMPPQNCLIVLMRRDLDEIHASEQRIAWAEASRIAELAVFGKSSGDPATIKYAYWDAHRPPNSYELLYEDLQQHPLYVPKEKRRFFGPRQTEGRSA